MFRKGNLVVVSGPSGTGKGTLVKQVCRNNSQVMFSTSATTRAPRKGEVDGKDYFYKTKQQFEEMIENEDFIEWVNYCDNYYGTPKKPIKEALDKGIDVLLEIEVEGALKVKNQFPECILMFVLPPSFEELKNRIINRQSETYDLINKRLNKARQEVKLINRYDYFIINDIIERAANEIICILVAEKHKVKRNIEQLNKTMKLYEEA